MRENKFKAKLIDVLKPMFRVYRIENKLEPGMPDLLVSRSSYHKSHIWIETKTDKGWLSKSQENWIEKTEDEIILIAKVIDDILWPDPRLYIYRQDFNRPAKYPFHQWVCIYEDTWPNCDQKALWEFIMEQ